MPRPLIPARSTSRLLLCGFAGLLGACGPTGLVPESASPATGYEATGVKEAESLWLGPNVGSVDLLKMFSEPDRWSAARDKTGVFQFYIQQLAATSAAACPSCGDNILPGFDGVDAFNKLKAWNIGIAIETGAVKHHTCDGEVAAQGAAGVIGLVKDRGASVRYVAMDEPYIGGEQRIGSETCGYTMARSAQETARFLRKLATLHPDVKVGDIEPYPYFRVPQLLAWLDELARNGEKPAFFHVDIDRVAVKNARLDVSADLRALKAGVAARGIPFGVIFWGHELDIPRGAASPDRSYYDAVMGWVGTVQAAIGAPDHAIFQSWLRSSDGRNVVPKNLSESDYSHTRLLNDGWARFAPTPPPPGPGDSERIATIKVQHGYKGVLGRDADSGGLAGFVAAIRGGLKLTDFCRTLFGSDEYRTTRAALTTTQLVDSLYQGILERAADPGGAASSAAEITAGRRAELCAAMLDSAEFRTRFLP